MYFFCNGLGLGYFFEQIINAAAIDVHENQPIERALNTDELSILPTVYDP